MTQHEQEMAIRLVSARNKRRIEVLKEQGVGAADSATAEDGEDSETGRGSRALPAPKEYSDT
jgi:hypothetical protein